MPKAAPNLRNEKSRIPVTNNKVIVKKRNGPVINPNAIMAEIRPAQKTTENKSSYLRRKALAKKLGKQISPPPQQFLRPPARPLAQTQNKSDNGSTLRHSNLNFAKNTTSNQREEIPERPRDVKPMGTRSKHVMFENDPDLPGTSKAGMKENEEEFQVNFKPDPGALKSILTGKGIQAPPLTASKFRSLSGFRRESHGTIFRKQSLGPTSGIFGPNGINKVFVSTTKGSMSLHPEDAAMTPGARLSAFFTQEAKRLNTPGSQFRLSPALMRFQAEDLTTRKQLDFNDMSPTVTKSDFQFSQRQLHDNGERFEAGESSVQPTECPTTMKQAVSIASSSQKNRVAPTLSEQGNGLVTDDSGGDDNFCLTESWRKTDGFGARLMDMSEENLKGELKSLECEAHRIKSRRMAILGELARRKDDPNKVQVEQESVSITEENGGGNWLRGLSTIAEDTDGEISRGPSAEKGGKSRARGKSSVESSCTQKSGGSEKAEIQASAHSSTNCEDLKLRKGRRSAFKAVDKMNSTRISEVFADQATPSEGGSEKRRKALKEMLDLSGISSADDDTATMFTVPQQMSLTLLTPNLVEDTVSTVNSTVTEETATLAEEETLVKEEDTTVLRQLRNRTVKMSLVSPSASVLKTPKARKGGQKGAKAEQHEDSGSLIIVDDEETTEFLEPPIRTPFSLRNKAAILTRRQKQEAIRNEAKETKKSTPKMEEGSETKRNLRSRKLIKNEPSVEDLEDLSPIAPKRSADHLEIPGTGLRRSERNKITGTSPSAIALNDSTLDRICDREVDDLCLRVRSISQQIQGEQEVYGRELAEGKPENPVALQLVYGDENNFVPINETL